MISLSDIPTRSAADLAALSPTDLDALIEEAAAFKPKVIAWAEEKRENQLAYYQPVSEEARKFHCSRKQKRVALGGNGSGKSETNLVDLAIAMTGEVPESLKDDYPRDMLRPPLACRLIVKSLTNTWEQSIKPKLQWHHWTGLPDGRRGHWGWIPRRFLIKGKWEESWSEKYRTLTLNNGSTCQVMSHDQEVADFASASIHDIRIDEGPKHSLWRENAMRLREGGRISLAMTPPDDRSSSWDAAWVYDELYSKGLPGPNQDPDIDSFTFFTEQNPFLADDFIEKAGRDLTPEQREVRFHGRFMHLGGLIFPMFADVEKWWCFRCNKITFSVGEGSKPRCGTCDSEEVIKFCHMVEPFEGAYQWPCVYLLDPHPRKDVMMSWVAVDPSDDWWQVAELSVDGTPMEVRDAVYDLEKSLGLFVAKRIIDPKMAGSQANNAGRRHITVRDVYDGVGLRCENADTNFHAGKDTVIDMLKPDPRSRLPRLHIFNTCLLTPSQFGKFSWDEWARYSEDDRDAKATPKNKNDDMPKLLGYLGNAKVCYAHLSRGMGYTKPMRKRVGAY